jgi:hypothetical protein
MKKPTGAGFQLETRNPQLETFCRSDTICQPFFDNWHSPGVRVSHTRAHPHDPTYQLTYCFHIVFQINYRNIEIIKLGQTDAESLSECASAQIRALLEWGFPEPIAQSRR